MARSKHILALLVALVALVVLAPAASAANGTDGFRYRSADPNPRASSVDPNPLKWGSLERERRHARGIGRKAMKVKVIGLQGVRYNR